MINLLEEILDDLETEFEARISARVAALEEVTDIEEKEEGLKLQNVKETSEFAIQTLKDVISQRTV